MLISLSKYQYLPYIKERRCVILRIQRSQPRREYLLVDVAALFADFGVAFDVNFGVDLGVDYSISSLMVLNTQYN